MRPTTLVLLAGCNVVFGFDDIHPAPHVIATPGPHEFAGTNLFYYVKAVDIAIASDEPGTTIYYTTDGTTPTHASMHGPAPLTVTLDEGPTTLTYFGENAAGSDDVHADVYHFDPSQGSQTGYVVTGTALDGGAPIAVVAPGDTLTMAVAHVQIWAQTDCAQCAIQLVYGVGTTDQGCLFDSERDDASGPGAFPGAEHDATFTLTAPMTTGVHDVNVANNEQFTCDDALALGSLMNRPDVTRIGVLIVE